MMMMMMMTDLATNFQQSSNEISHRTSNASLKKGSTHPPTIQTSYSSLTSAHCAWLFNTKISIFRRAWVLETQYSKFWAIDILPVL